VFERAVLALLLKTEERPTVAKLWGLSAPSQ
jgi:hypothetical protein